MRRLPTELHTDSSLDFCVFRILTCTLVDLANIRHMVSVVGYAEYAYKRVAMGVSSCSVIGDFWPVVHRESRILLVVHRARYMAVIRES